MSFYWNLPERDVCCAVHMHLCFTLEYGGFDFVVAIYAVGNCTCMLKVVAKADIILQHL